MAIESIDQLREFLDVGSLRIRATAGGSVALTPSNASTPETITQVAGNVGIDAQLSLFDDGLRVSAGLGVGLFNQTQSTQCAYDFYNGDIGTEFCSASISNEWYEDTYRQQHETLSSSSVGAMAIPSATVMLRLNDAVFLGVIGDIGLGTVNRKPHNFFAGVALETQTDGLGFKAAIGHSWTRPLSRWMGTQYRSQLGLQIAVTGNLWDFDLRQKEE